MELIQFLLNIKGVTYILTEIFCQDPLESFFGKHRMKGGSTTDSRVCSNEATKRKLLTSRISIIMSAKPHNENNSYKEITTNVDILINVHSHGNNTSMVPPFQLSPSVGML